MLTVVEDEHQLLCAERVCNTFSRYRTRGKL